MFANFFSLVQESGWYKDFLLPVVDLIPSGSSVLDIGTGTGKMIEFIIGQNNPAEPHKIVGTDTSSKMLDIAEEKLAAGISSGNISLVKTTAGEALPFNEGEFDIVSICNVLFNLSEELQTQMLDDSRRVLNDNGQIIVLTPTGKGSFWDITRLYKPFFHLKNITMYIWFFATKNRAIPWLATEFLKQYAAQNDLVYKRHFILHGFAQIETISAK